MPRRGQLIAIAAMVALPIGLSACFTTTADFQDDAETFIVENDELREALLAEADARFVDATCAEPTDQEEGTTFACTATDSNGATWEFEIEITSSSEYEVNLSRAPTEG
jgi:Domain of unknown function (DUF4333)